MGTDVVGVSGADLLVSCGGASNWERLNAAAGFLVGLAVGKFVSDFPGDGGTISSMRMAREQARVSGVRDRESLDAR